MDANQKWGVIEAIRRTKELAELDPWWMEEPTLLAYQYPDGPVWNDHRISAVT